MMPKKDIDIICAGEILVDFIGSQVGVNLEKTIGFQRFLGGSPTNVAVNMSQLGLTPRVVSTIGNDGLGDFIENELRRYKLSLESVRRLDTHPTSLVLVSKTTGTPDFIAYRQADKLINEQQLNDQLFKRSRIFHTTCFALSKNPARTSIMNAAGRANKLGCKLSIDVNYSPRIWPNTEKAISTLKEYCSYNPLVKVSDDDMFRLFGEKMPQEELFTFFMDNGASVVCLTLGSKGVKVALKEGRRLELPAEKIERIVDATGAGDAFWSGFLFGYLKDFEVEKSIKMGLKLAGIKLQYLGRLPEDRDILDELLKIR